MYDENNSYQADIPQRDSSEQSLIQNAAAYKPVPKVKRFSNSGVIIFTAIIAALYIMVLFLSLATANPSDDIQIKQTDYVNTSVI